MTNNSIYEIIKKLKSNIKNTDQNKSSHWHKHTRNIEEYLDITKNYGFGSYEKKTYKEFFYIILRRLVFGNKVFKTKLYKQCKIIFDKDKRVIDADIIRHIFSYNIIKNYVNPKSICIIGDGKLNAVLCSHLMFPDAKIYSINLSEVLLHDLLILDKLNLKIKSKISLVENVETEEDENLLNIVPSNFKKFLMDKKIDLFINVASFQEMTKVEISNYFEIIKSNKSLLYCCNREYKKLVGGEEIYFDEYPFSNSKILFKEDCQFYKKYYSLRYPFIKKFPGNIKHCLVKFS